MEILPRDILLIIIKYQFPKIDTCFFNNKIKDYENVGEVYYKSHNNEYTPAGLLFVY